ncbi:MAG: type II toxin-antitoxin system PemK/MazF family toxin [Fusobacteriaceae bacterium]|jgi:mRNA interferase MazF|nr:type II toxin-antitoxin system PemK/MazF family toxin [Fusobacteriaceae bacterium]
MIEKENVGKGEPVLQLRVYLFNPNPARGAEINKERPCLVISNNIVNENLETVWVLPITSQYHDYATRVPFINDRGDENYIVVDQLRAIDKTRLSKYIYTITDIGVIEEVERIIKLMMFRRK